MKLLKRLIGIVVVLALAAGIAFMLMKKHSGGDEEKKSEKPEEEKSRIIHAENGEMRIKLDEETQKRLALAVEPLAAATQRTQIAAFGHVVDPSPLVALDS